MKNHPEIYANTVDCIPLYHEQEHPGEELGNRDEQDHDGLEDEQDDFEHFEEQDFGGNDEEQEVLVDDEAQENYVKEGDISDQSNPVIPAAAGTAQNSVTMNLP